MLKFEGCSQFRQRLILSTLSGKAVRIDSIRAQDQSPGLRDYEASLLRLLEKLTNGCLVEINETGTSLRYKPGVIICGGGIVHDCGTSRSIGYFLEALVLIALFAKRPLSITLKGITNDHVDPSVDTWRTVTLPLLRRAAGLDDAGLELKVVRRGARPGGGGEVQLRVPLLKQLPLVNMMDEGMVKRIRGIAVSMRVPPQNANRMVDAARGVLNQLLADVYIFTDAAAGAAAGASPGYGITLVAETTSGCLLSAEVAATQGTGAASAGGAATADEGPLVVPEDIGQAAAQLLLDEVARGGVTDGTHQALLLLLAALGPEEMNQVRLGPLTPYAVRTLRHIKEFFQVHFSMRTEQKSSTIFLSCIGAGLKNINRKVT